MKSDEGDLPGCNQDLLERGRLALKAIHYQEQIVRYQAQAVALQAAMQLAEQGNPTSLERWLSVHGAEVATPHIQPTTVGRSETDCSAKDASWALDTIRECNALSDTIVESDTIQSHRGFDSAHEVPAPRLKFAWDRMESAARARQKDRQLSSIVPKTTPESETNVGSESKSDSIAVAPHAWLESCDEDRGAVAGRPRLLVAPHLWASLVLHLVLILGLSIYVVRAVQSTPVLSIVSSTAESDRVLMETPIDGESTWSDLGPPSEPVSMENPHDLSLAMSNPSFAIEADSTQQNKPSPKDSLLPSGSTSTNVLTGNKIGGTEFFGLRATGNTFVYVVDNSPSMKRDGAFDSAKNEMVRSLTSMKSRQRFHIGFFGDEMEWLPNLSGDAERFPIYATPENLGKALEWLKRISVQKNGKAPNEALSKAIQMQPDGIFLLFDGHTKIDVAKYLRRENRSDDILFSDAPRVPIHVVHFFNEEYQKTMRQIAEENGGTYRFVPRPQQATKGMR